MVHPLLKVALLGASLSWTTTALTEGATLLPRTMIVQSSHREIFQRSTRRDSREIGVIAGFERLPLVRRSQVAQGARAPSKGALRWLTSAGRLLSPGSAVPPGGIRIFPVQIGTGVIRLRGGLQRISVAAILPTRGSLAHPASLAITRSLPQELRLSHKSAQTEPEAVTFVIASPRQFLPSFVDIVSEGTGGRYLDALRKVPLVSASCEGMGQGDPLSEVACARTPPLRIGLDVVERNHPAAASRTLMGEVGGHLDVHLSPTTRASFPIGAPALLEKNGPGRYRVQVRARILRTYPGGPPAVGGTDQEAIRIVKAELQVAARMWGQCGITLGGTEQLDIQVVDPPNISWLTIGCSRGVRASGGYIQLLADGKRVTVKTYPGQSPESVAGRLGESLSSVGLRYEIYRNAEIRSQAMPSFDLVVRDRKGAAVSLVPVSHNRFSFDSSLNVCRGELDLSDGLHHFSDFDASAGTIEERALLRGVGDRNPQTIDLFVVPVFGGVGRIGESFIYGRRASVQNAIIIDRTGLQAGARSFTMAHELGHILLDLPGHPDDFGVDTPTSLMDADAADPTLFGPRRLSLAECQRAIKQSGRKAPVPLLIDWPLGEKHTPAFR